MCEPYIPDLTERYPEGFNGIDMYEPYDLEAIAWAEMEREYYENERREIERITNIGYKIIKRTYDGPDDYALIECNDNLLVICIIKDNKIITIYDSAKNNAENYEHMNRYYEEMIKG